MENILQYLKWRGDLSFEERQWNEVDALICALLGYVEWDGIVLDIAVSLQYACQTLCQKDSHEDMVQTYAYAPMIADMIPLLIDAKRYQDVQLQRYISICDQENDIQFAAITILLPFQALYISYRGTDCTLLGWKEDFQMMLDTIPSQKLALQYLKETYQDLVIPKKLLGIQYGKTNKSLYLGCHSKGGNLAMYAAICCDEMKEYINHIYSFDGPGFQETFYQEHEYQSIIKCIHNYVPTSSLIGRIMTHKEKHIILNAYGNGLQQHDAFYWKISQSHFDYALCFDEETQHHIKYIHDVLLSRTDQEKKDFISLIFTILDNMKINLITDFNEITFKQAFQGIKELSTMNFEESKIFFDFLKFIYGQIKTVYFSKKKE
ncbi:Mbeg1-like protein [Candidatus Stoquefichus massiliensis]|uniref:Mbeg1-like protein n=1 Tax=Candidatus Stoquefichus massiliensis TaxID=1470350 RepID=UPI0004883CB6|nr:Mbeg1-like protein [Candidatus Stoquefichus massiliensis]